MAWPLRRRLALGAAAAVAVAIVLAALVGYWVVRDQLLRQVDGELNTQAAAVQHGDFHALGGPLPGLSASAGGPAPYAQIVLANGTVEPLRGDLTLPVDANATGVANGRDNTTMTTVTVGGAHLREIIFPVLLNDEDQPQSAAIQLARPLAPIDRVLERLRLILVLLCIGGVALAAALGRLAAGRVLAPLSEVARSAQHVSETEDLTTRIHVHTDDEIGQLARRFNAMIERLQYSRAELDESVQSQRQLVADASHELRTPITSLRTNVEVLLAGGELQPHQRDRLLADVVEQTEELSMLVNDLIELARGDMALSTTEDVRLDRVVEEALARARRNAPGVRFQATLSPAVVPGVAERLSRAVGNLLDNAARHSPEGATVLVVVDEHGVSVRDHGTGIDESDLPHIFDRFYRGVNARGRQGSGLGLAIVRQVAEQHGGSVRAENAPGGGALFNLRLPATRADADASGQPGQAAGDGSAHPPPPPTGSPGPPQADPVRRGESPAPVPGGQS